MPQRVAAATDFAQPTEAAIASVQQFGYQGTTRYGEAFTDKAIHPLTSVQCGAQDAVRQVVCRVREQGTRVRLLFGQRWTTTVTATSDATGATRYAPARTNPEPDSLNTAVKACAKGGWTIGIPVCTYFDNRPVQLAVARQEHRFTVPHSTGAVSFADDQLRCVAHYDHGSANVGCRTGVPGDGYFALYKSR